MVSKEPGKVKLIAEVLATQDDSGSDASDRIYERFEALVAATTEKRASEILFRLGFDKAMQAKKNEERLDSLSKSFHHFRRLSTAARFIRGNILPPLGGSLSCTNLLGAITPVFFFYQSISPFRGTALGEPSRAWNPRLP